MKNRIAGLGMVMWLMLFCFAPKSLPAQTNAATEDPNLTTDEKEGCSRNLKVLYSAIQAYRLDHKDIPNWLSDLVPKYVNDPNVLICPVCKRTGQIEASALADPNIPCSYLYEFCPVPLGKADAPANPAKTHRDWKRQQMALAGSIVPIVRCRQHAMVLNLAFDGQIYESPASWEVLLTNQMNVAELKPGRIFAGATNRSSTAVATSKRAVYPPRDPQARPGLINLTPYYNATLKESWHGNAKNTLSSLPMGVQNFAGVDYDVRGIVQLGSKSPSAKRFTARVNGIKIQQKCARLHFLHAVGFGSVTNDGQLMGSYVVHFATNHMQLEIPIIYGRDVRNWHSISGETATRGLTPAWTGTNEVSAAAHTSIRLFTTDWLNLAPEVKIETIDFISAMDTPAPFLVAITAE